MPRPSSIHVCSACGHETRPLGRAAARAAGSGTRSSSRSARRPRGGPARAAPPGHAARAAPATPVALRDIEAVEHDRLSTGIGELDNVLGGGIVPGSLVLIGGAPGIGKSTLTTMAVANLQTAGRRTLYVSAEESAAQIRLRAQRLGAGEALAVPVIAETDLHTVLATLEQERPEVCVIDSVQTLHSEDLTSAAGSVAQVREVAGELMQVAKRLRDRGAARRACHQGGIAGRTAGARAPGRLRAAVRGRARAHVPDGAGDQEPVRLHQRGGRVRDARPRPGGGARRLGALRGGGDPSARAARCCARWRARARCSSRCRRWSAPRSWCRRGGWSPAWTATGWRWSWPCWAVTRASGSAPPTCSSTWSAGVRVDEPGSDLAVALAVASASKRVALTGEDGRPLACFGELGLTGELRTVAHGDRRVDRGTALRADSGRRARAVQDAAGGAGRRAGPGAGGAGGGLTMMSGRTGFWGPIGHRQFGVKSPVDAAAFR